MPDNHLDPQQTRAATSQPTVPSPQSEELLRLIAENIEDYAIFAIDLEGRCASWNPGVEKLLGYAEDDFVGQDACMIFTPEDQAHDACGHELRTAKENGRAEDRRWHLRKDGSRFFANGLLMSLKDEAGNIRGYSKIMRDDTRRKAAEDASAERERAEEALRGSEERFRLFVTASSDTLYRMSADWTVMRDLQGMDFLADTAQPSRAWLDGYIPEADQPRVRAAIAEAIRTKSKFELEHRVIRADGTIGWTFSRAIPVLDGRGEIVEWFGAASDTTERKDVEAERARLLLSLEVERARLTSVFAKAPAFVAVLRGSEHVFELTNPAYLQLIGHRDVIGKTVREALPEIAGQGFFELLDRVFRTGEPYEGRELPVSVRREPDGPPEERFIDLLYQPLVEADGRASGIFVHGIDITDQVRARREAEEANRVKDEFLATLSHELRTPLTSILGWTNMLASGGLQGDAAAQALGTINRNARAQVQMIDDLLDIGRIITGKLRLDVREVDLPSVVIGALDTLRPAAEAKNIKLQTLLDPHAGPISGDPDRLQQVVWNLVSNAIKFTPKGGRVQVRVERINSHVEIVVSDTGRGIAPEFLPHVFDRFRQADQTTTRAVGGLGLGLAIVRQLVELHGGTVGVDSPGAGKGTTFAIGLPLAAVRATNTHAKQIERVHPTAHTGKVLDCPPEITGLRVLIVDDEPDTREMLAYVLTNCGAQVLTASSAAEGLEALRRERPDVLVSDIGMPEEDGYSFIAEVRKLAKEEGGDTAAVALTVYARAEDRVRAFRSGFQIHIPKPVEPAELVSVVASLAGRNGRH